MPTSIFSRRILLSNTAILIYLALIKLALHFITNGQYGYNRDELYYIACSEHLDFGYVDHPPLIALVAKITIWILGDSLFAIRFLPALIGASMVFLTGLMVRRLGGGLFAQCLACIALLIAPTYLILNTLFTTNVFDQLFWVVCFYLIFLLLKRNDPRYWLAIGLVVGLGLMNKHTMIFFIAGLLTGLILTPNRKFFLNEWLWSGALIALVIFLPHIVWQINHGWPTLEFLQRAVINRMAEVSPLEFFYKQIISFHPLTFPIWLIGLYYYLFSSKAKRYRLLGWIYVSVFVILAVQKSRGYYLAPAYPMLFASGAFTIEKFIRQQSWNWLKPAILIILITGGAILAPLGLPLLSVDAAAEYGAYLGLGLRPVYEDMLGWENMVATVAGVYHSLPAEEKAKCAIMANNYGQASAIDFFGDRYGLPGALSTHNSYWLWGPGDYSGEIVITVGVRFESLKQGFDEVEQAAVVTHEYVMWYETNQPVYIWRGPKISLQEMWPRIKLFY